MALTTERLAGPARWRPGPPGLCPWTWQTGVGALQAGLPSPCCCVRPSWAAEGVKLTALSTPGGWAGGHLATLPLLCSLCSHCPPVSVGIPWEAVTCEQLRILHKVAGSESRPWTTTTTGASSTVVEMVVETPV